MWTSITTAFHTANLVREERSPGLDLPCGERQKGVLEGIDRIRHEWEPISAPLSMNCLVLSRPCDHFELQFSCQGLGGLA